MLLGFLDAVEVTEAAACGCMPEIAGLCRTRWIADDLNSAVEAVTVGKLFGNMLSTLAGEGSLRDRVHQRRVFLLSFMPSTDEEQQVGALKQLDHDRPAGAPINRTSVLYGSRETD